MATINQYRSEAIGVIHEIIEAAYSIIAAQYRSQGYDVIVEPQKTDLPFDLDSYHPMKATSLK